MMTARSSQHAIAAAQYTRERDYWLKTLAELPAKSMFPYDYFISPGKTEKRKDTVEFNLSQDLCEKLIAISGGSDQRLFMVLVASIVLLLNKYTGASDILIGAPTLKQQLKANFINTVLILRNRLDERRSFKELLLQVRQDFQEAGQHINYPLETLLYQLNVSYTPEEDFPLADIAVLLRNIHDPEDIRHINCNMTFSFLRGDNAIKGEVEFNPLRYGGATIERIIAHFHCLLTQVLADVNRPLSGVDILLKEERQLILQDFNQPEMDLGNLGNLGSSIYDTFRDLFAGQVERTPDRIALVGSCWPFAADSNRSYLSHLSYNALDKKSGQAAKALIKRGVKPDTIVAIMMERSLEMVMGIIAVLKAGAAYLPIDPELPDERIDYMLKDSGAKILLTPETLSLPQMIYSADKSYMSHLPPCGTLAYIIYTSGSTGKPKGVMLEHHGFSNLKFFHERVYRVTAGDRVVQFSNCSFDASVWELSMALFNGAALCMVDKGTIGDYDRFSGFLAEMQITVVTLPPFYADRLDFDRLGSLRLLITAGSVPPLSLLIRCRQRIGMRYVNAYGPTEATICATSWDFDRNRKNSDLYAAVPIGKPLPNTSIYILASDYRLLSIGIAGEMFIAGVGLARGYLNRPELTVERFIPIPLKYYMSNMTYMSYSTHKNTILYKTGDLARWQPDGNIEFLGRVDNQVKIRGYRIELEEIEKRLLNYDGIKEVVVLKKEEKGEDQLVAYIAAGQAINPTEIRNFLSRVLPEYMIPSRFVRVEQFPIMPSGKVDKKSLSTLEPEMSYADYIPPANRFEEQLIEIWSEILGIEKALISAEANFFDLGGHSLKATILTSRVHKTFNIDLPLEIIFRESTVRGLGEYLRTAARQQFHSIPLSEKKEYYDLSSTQKRLYVLQQFEEGGIGYNIPQVVVLEGELDREKLLDAFRKVVRCHESLRTSFAMINRNPAQVIHDRLEFAFERIEPVSGAKADEPADMIKRFIRSFDLSRAPLLRVGLIREEDKRHILMVDMHHIITDGTSMSILIDALMTAYSGKELTPLPVQYKDYSEWRNRDKYGNVIKQQEAYWLNCLGYPEDIPVLNLPLDHARPLLQGFAGSTVTVELGKGETTALKALALQKDVTLYMVLLSIFNVLLARLSGQDDIIVGTAAAGRRHVDLQPIIGMFVNTLALRNYPVAEKTFAGFLAEVKEQTLKAFNNQEYPFEDLVEKVVSARRINRNPIFDAMFTFQNMEMTELRFPGLKLVPYDFESNISKFDLSLTSQEAGERLIFIFEYSTTLFERQTLQRWAGYFITIISSVIAAPDQRIQQIEVISEQERDRLLYELNDTRREYPVHKTIHEWFREQSEMTPDRAALVGIHQPLDTNLSGSNKSNRSNRPNGTYMSHLSHLSYKELDKETGESAEALKMQGVKPGAIVGILMERSLDMIAAVLTVLKTGAAYMPIDPEYPEERIEYMLKDSGAQLLLTAETLAAVSNTSNTSNTPYTSSLFNIPPGETQAYIIYTSGTTGKPKGVLVRHSSVVNLVNCQKRRFDIREHDRVLLFSSLCFDASVEQMFLALLTGAVLILVRRETLLENSRFERFVLRQSITHLHAVPAFLSQLEIPVSRHLKRVIAGGDVCPPSLAAKWIQTCDFYNEYGPTETTVTSIEIQVKAPDDNGSRLPIGNPIDNTTVYILDNGLRLVPFGAAGELTIGGEGVARGYLNNPELTNKKFLEVSEPFFKKVLTRRRQKLYRTGDLARWLPEGTLEFLGRVDDQVKIRGFRIEPGEIEVHLKNIDFIRDAVVIAVEKQNPDRTAEKYLAAYIVSDTELNEAELSELLRQKLPYYMVPAYFVRLDRIPLNSNGKINRMLLPAPQARIEGNFQAPSGEVELRLAEIWAQVLGIEKSAVGADGNFFQLGGHSLKATILISMIHKAFDIKISLAQLFLQPTIRGLARYIGTKGKDSFAEVNPVEKKEYYPLSSAQLRLYIQQQMLSDNITYNTSLSVVLEGELDSGKLQYIFQRLISRHEALRTSFVMVSGEPVQKIETGVKFEIEYLKAEGKSVMQQTSSFLRPFDLSRASLLRVRAIKTAEREHILMVDMHHIITDGTSLGLLVGEFMSLYAGQTPPGLKLQYKDFSQWQNRLLVLGEMKKQEHYWLGQFAGGIPGTSLPTDFPRPPVMSGQGEAVYFEIEPSLRRQLDGLITESETTLFMVMLAISNILLSKYTGREDMVIGTPIEGRRHADLRNIIGMFVNTLALRNQPARDKTFLDFLYEVKENFLKAFDNQDYQFEELVRQLGVGGQSSRNPLFDVVLRVVNNDSTGIEIPGLKLKPYGQETLTSRFDLVISAVETGAAGNSPGIDMTMLFAADLYKRSTVETMSAHFREILRAVLENREIKLRNIDVSSGLTLARVQARKEEMVFGF